MSAKSSLRTPIKRARGLGASGTGTHHFWVQRVTAVALIPLTVWFVVEFMTVLIHAERAGVQLWLKNPLSALAAAALTLALFWHARLGLQTIIEDYVNRKGKKLATLIFTDFCIFIFGAMALISIARLHFIGM